MEIKKSIDLRKLTIALYSLFFVVYVILGLTPAEATQYSVDATLAIPAIDLKSDVTNLKLANYKLETPDTIVGSFTSSENNTLLIGHVTTVFSGLDSVEIGDVIFYNDKSYTVREVEVLTKQEVDMAEILEPREVDTLTIMTCAGEIYEDGDASHRLIIIAN